MERETEFRRIIIDVEHGQFPMMWSYIGSAATSLGIKLEAVDSPAEVAEPSIHLDEPSQPEAIVFNPEMVTMFPDLDDEQKQVAVVTRGNLQRFADRDSKHAGQGEKVINCLSRGGRAVVSNLYTTPEDEGYTRTHGVRVDQFENLLDLLSSESFYLTNFGPQSLKLLQDFYNTLIAKPESIAPSEEEKPKFESKYVIELPNNDGEQVPLILRDSLEKFVRRNGCDHGQGTRTINAIMYAARGWPYGSPPDENLKNFIQILAEDDEARPKVIGLRADKLAGLVALLKSGYEVNNLGPVSVEILEELNKEIKSSED